MKKVTLKKLRESLSEITELASKGQIVEITKYNKPFAMLYPATPSGLHIGRKGGKTSLTSVATRASKGRYLQYIDKDRSNGKS